MVCPTISGMIVDRRDQVLITRLSPRRFISTTLVIRCVSTNGPFLIDRGISPLPPPLPAPADDHLVGRLGLTGSALFLPPRAGGVSAPARLPLSSTQGMIDRVHGHAANRWTLA